MDVHASQGGLSAWVGHGSHGDACRSLALLVDARLCCGVVRALEQVFQAYAAAQEGAMLHLAMFFGRCDATLQTKNNDI